MENRTLQRTGDIDDDVKKEDKKVDDNIQTILLLLGGIAFYVICYIISFKICSHIKRINDFRKKKLVWLITNGICFIFFLVYGLIDNYCGVRVVPLEALWFILTPISLLGLIWNTIAFFNLGQRK